jgi:hypothetical protein
MNRLVLNRRNIAITRMDLGKRTRHRSSGLTSSPWCSPPPMPPGGPIIFEPLRGAQLLPRPGTAPSAASRRRVGHQHGRRVAELTVAGEPGSGNRGLVQARLFIAAGRPVARPIAQRRHPHPETAVCPGAGVDGCDASGAAGSPGGRARCTRPASRPGRHAKR